MKFTKVIGKIDDKMLQKVEDKLTKIFLELGTKYDNTHIANGIGGDPLIFTLVYPVEHICTQNLATAATDGIRYYWNPKFVIKQHDIGLRFITAHEAWHAIYMHPQRRGSRLPKLWNIAVDYVVNAMVLDDLKARKLNAGEMFTKYLGKYITLKDYMEKLKDPFKDPSAAAQTQEEEVKLPHPNEDRELTEKEIKQLEKREKNPKAYFADPDLDDEMKSPEKIYDMLYQLLPKCPTCGRVGVYKKPDKNKGKDKDKGKGKGKDKDKNKDKGDQPGDQGDPSQDQGDQDGQGNGQGDQPGDQPGQCCGGNSCPDCGGDQGYDALGEGATLDDHMDTEETEEKLAKRISDAVESARRLAGSIPAGIEEALGILTQPKVKWQDVIRSKLLKVRLGHGRNDWCRFKTRPMFCGLLVPKRKDYYASFGCLLDCSGSMGQEDIAFGISQLQGLDDRAEGTIVPADSEIYWSQATKIKKCSQDELSKIKVVGRGGTIFGGFFSDYEKNVGACDFLIVITDGYLMDSDIADMKDPGIPVYWIVTAPSGFKPSFGKVYDLRN